MKRITLFFAMLLGLSVFQTASAVDSETARAAKRTSTNTISTNSTSTRFVTSSNKTSEQNRTENARSTVKNNRQNQSVQPRTTTQQQPAIRQRSATTAPTLNERTKTVTARTTSTNTRGTITTRSATPRKANPKNTLTRSAINQKPNRIVRATTLNDDKISEIKSKDYSKCKTVYWECMDEFCANKDTTLRRCACSSRIHEFDDIKQQLSDAEEKMVGFNQKLLTVGLDKEDALAISSATEGEKAFEQKDISESEKLLQKITKTLNSSSDSKINSDLSAISLDLDMDSAWDSVDSMSGIATTAKSGLGLYNAAQPICLEMAREVCSDDEFSITENSYKLAIQQDCDTVAKAYKSKYNSAMEKIHESGALLDMARLNAYQQRNSDDVLTCKRKILEKLSEPAVCGEKLYRCLDITGQYIDQSDGSAFLSGNLYNLTTLLTAPSSTDTKWTRVSGNDQFVKFLDSKKEYLESATEQCQDVADTVWKDFLEDALAQIKLAQNAKLEEIRRSCTKLIAECKTNALTSIEEFDAAAISTFKIMADTTANAMCADVQSACTALIDSSLGDETWSTAVASMTADITYDAIIENCTAVGRTCIMQKCGGTGGSFALCENSDSDARQSIIKMESCWDEVLSCVNQAKNSDLKIIVEQNSIATSFTYNNNCTATDDYACLITHTIWGDCSTAYSNSDASINKSYTSSLLTWLADNTNDSCYASECPAGFMLDDNYGDKTYPNCPVCAPKITPTDNETETNTNHIIRVIDDITNYCPDGCAAKDSWGNCCTNTIFIDEDGTKICVPTTAYKAVNVQTVQCTSTDSYYCPDGSNKKITLYCVTDNDGYPKYDNNGAITCGTGYWVLVDTYGNYFNPFDDSLPIYQTSQTQGLQKPTMSFKDVDNQETSIQYTYQKPKLCRPPCLSVPAWRPNYLGPAKGSLSNHFMITYQEP